MIRYYGPSKPQTGHLYGFPVLLQCSHLQISALPQFGHRKCVALSYGFIGLPHELHTGTVGPWSTGLGLSTG